jgi:predicted TIM-barrel fold metal-dependent hydrolase
MREVGVDRALLVSPWTLYGSDASYAVEVYRGHPDRFGLIAPIDPYQDGAAAAVTTWGDVPGAVGIRLMAGLAHRFRGDHRPVQATVDAALAQTLPVCVFCPNRLSIIDELAQLYPNVQFVLDHLGLTQPLKPPPPDDPFAELDSVLALAGYPNVAVKVTGVCTLSHRPFPFDDLWEPLSRVFDAFGIERCMWGTDWTRAMEFVSYADSVAAFRDHLSLSQSERDALMGGTVERIFARGAGGGWPPCA